MNRFSNRIRGGLIHICGAQLPLTMSISAPGEPMEAKYKFTVDEQLSISCHVGFDWLTGLYERGVSLRVGAQIVCEDSADAMPTVSFRPVGGAVIQEAEDEAVTLASNELASLLGRALDLIENEVNPISLHGLNLQTTQEAKLSQPGN